MKICNCIDKLPLVRILQIAAIVIFVTYLLQFGVYFEQASRASMGMSLAAFWNVMMLIIMSFGRTLFEPLVLLAAAQIIKILSEKK